VFYLLLVSVAGRVLQRVESKLSIPGFQHHRT
jgi:hypothetical protein